MQSEYEIGVGLMRVQASLDAISLGEPSSKTYLIKYGLPEHWRNFYQLLNNLHNAKM
jgi:hypothetical protein